MQTSFVFGLVRCINAPMLDNVYTDIGEGLLERGLLVVSKLR